MCTGTGDACAMPRAADLPRLRSPGAYCINQMGAGEARTTPTCPDPYSKMYVVATGYTDTPGLARRAPASPSEGSACSSLVSIYADRAMLKDQIGAVTAQSSMLRCASIVPASSPLGEQDRDRARCSEARHVHGERRHPDRLGVPHRAVDLLLAWTNLPAMRPTSSSCSSRLPRPVAERRTRAPRIRRPAWARAPGNAHRRRGRSSGSWLWFRPPRAPHLLPVNQPWQKHPTGGTGYLDAPPSTVTCSAPSPPCANSVGACSPSKPTMTRSHYGGLSWRRRRRPVQALPLCGTAPARRWTRSPPPDRVDRRPAGRRRAPAGHVASHRCRRRWSSRAARPSLQLCSAAKAPAWATSRAHAREPTEGVHLPELLPGFSSISARLALETRHARRGWSVKHLAFPRRTGRARARAANPWASRGSGPTVMAYKDGACSQPVGSVVATSDQSPACGDAPGQLGAREQVRHGELHGWNVHADAGDDLADDPVLPALEPRWARPARSILRTGWAPGRDGGA